MTLGNMRQLGVRNLLASWLSHTCRHTSLVDVSSGNKIDVRPNWKEQPAMPTKLAMALVTTSFPQPSRPTATLDIPFDIQPMCVLDAAYDHA
jgi:hypothetical protein